MHYVLVMLAIGIGALLGGRNGWLKGKERRESPEPAPKQRRVKLVQPLDEPEEDMSPAELKAMDRWFARFDGK